MKIYLDTSSLIKLYHHEIGTNELDQVFEDFMVEQIFLSEITKIEFSSAIWKKVRTKDLTSKEAHNLIESFKTDFTKYSFIKTDNDLIQSACDLVTKYGEQGLRTLDSIQLATAIKIKKDLFFAITSDDLLKRLLKEEKIKTK